MIKIIDERKVWTSLILDYYIAEELLSPFIHRYTGHAFRKWRLFDAAAEYGKKISVNHLNEIVKREVNGFWYFLKSDLKRKKGTTESNFYLHLKESEFRYNTEEDSGVAYSILIKEFVEDPLRL
jgi:hypothetical protein